MKIQTRILLGLTLTLVFQVPQSSFAKGSQDPLQTLEVTSLTQGPMDNFSHKDTLYDGDKKLGEVSCNQIAPSPSQQSLRSHTSSLADITVEYAFFESKLGVFSNEKTGFCDRLEAIVNQKKKAIIALLPGKTFEVQAAAQRTVLGN